MKLDKIVAQVFLATRNIIEAEASWEVVFLEMCLFLILGNALSKYSGSL